MNREKKQNERGNKLYSYTRKKDLTSQIFRVFVILGGIVAFLMFISYLQLGNLFWWVVSLLLFLFILFVLVRDRMVEKMDKIEVYEYGIWVLYPKPNFLPDNNERYFRFFDDIISIDYFYKDNIDKYRVEIITEEENISINIREKEEVNKFIKIVKRSLSEYNE